MKKVGIGITELICKRYNYYIEIIVILIENNTLKLLPHKLIS
jgi:hypothetical protein